MGFWKRYAKAAALNVGIALLVLFVKGFNLKIYYVDAFGVAGAVSVLLGLLAWIASAGAFDTIGYGFSTFRGDRRYKDLYEYTVRKNEKRSRRKKAFLPLVIVGAVFVGISFLIPVG
ncbi:MAG TPA: hypothetical protein DCZ91_22950 [Lachnospiraceae bacterium]|nr:hypothetical protein [Lachnospiraceae bacterium]